MINEHGDMIAITAYYKLQAQVDDLQRQLDNARTDWLCDTCEGRGCEAENQNAVLIAELEEHARLNGKGSEREAALLAKLEQLKRETAALREKVDDWENAVAHALDHRPDEQHCTCVAPLVGKVKQLERENAALRAALDAARKEQP